MAASSSFYVSNSHFPVELSHCRFSWSTLWPLVYLVFTAWIHFELKPHTGSTFDVVMWWTFSTLFFISHQCSLLWDVGSRLFKAQEENILCQTLSLNVFYFGTNWPRRFWTSTLKRSHSEPLPLAEALNFEFDPLCVLSKADEFRPRRAQKARSELLFSMRNTWLVIGLVGIYLDSQKPRSCHFYLYRATYFAHKSQVWTFLQNNCRHFASHVLFDFFRLSPLVQPTTFSIRVGSPTGAMVEERWDFLHFAARISIKYGRAFAEWAFELYGMAYSSAVILWPNVS